MFAPEGCVRAFLQKWTQSNRVELLVYLAFSISTTNTGEPEFGGLKLGFRSLGPGPTCALRTCLARVTRTKREHVWQREREREQSEEWKDRAGFGMFEDRGQSLLWERLIGDLFCLVSSFPRGPLSLSLSRSILLLSLALSLSLSLLSLSLSVSHLCVPCRSL